MTPLELLRKHQFSHCCFECQGCGALHRHGCKPGCEFNRLLNPVLTIVTGVDHRTGTIEVEVFGDSWAAWWNVYYDLRYPGRRIREAMAAAAALEQDLFAPVAPRESRSRSTPRRSTRPARRRKRSKRGSSTR